MLWVPILLWCRRGLHTGRRTEAGVRDCKLLMAAARNSDCEIMGYVTGRAFEHELKEYLKKGGWFVVRSAGSKKPDLVAAKNGKIMVIECKVTKEKKAYLDKEEVQNLKAVAEAFGGEGMFAIKQKGRPWTLIGLNSLKETKNQFVVSL